MNPGGHPYLVEGRARATGGDVRVDTVRVKLDGAEYQLTGRDAELLRRFLELRPQPRAYPQFKLTFDAKGRRVRPGLQVD